MPGLKVVAPYSSEDCRGLLKAAIRDPNPVVFLENELLYGVDFPVSDEAMSPDFTMEIGKAKIERAGTDVTLVAFSKMVGTCLQAAEVLAAQGIEAEVINLLSLRPIDRECIINSVKKTNRIVAAEEGWPQCSITSEVCAIVMESEAFDHLDAPVKRVTAPHSPVPYNRDLEQAFMPQPEDVVGTVKNLLGRE